MPRRDLNQNLAGESPTDLRFRPRSYWGDHRITVYTPEILYGDLIQNMEPLLMTYHYLRVSRFKYEYFLKA